MEMTRVMSEVVEISPVGGVILERSQVIEILKRILMKKIGLTYTRMEESTEVYRSLLVGRFHFLYPWGDVSDVVAKERFKVRSLVPFDGGFEGGRIELRGWL